MIPQRYPALILLQVHPERARPPNSQNLDHNLIARSSPTEHLLITQLTPQNPTTATRLQFTDNLTTRPLPTSPPPSPSWKKLAITLRTLLDKLAHHPAMAQNLHQTYMTPAADKNKVYFMWDFVGRTLVLKPPPPTSLSHIQHPCHFFPAPSSAALKPQNATFRTQGLGLGVTLTRNTRANTSTASPPPSKISRAKRRRPGRMRRVGRRWRGG